MSNDAKANRIRFVDFPFPLRKKLLASITGAILFLALACIMAILIKQAALLIPGVSISLLILALSAKHYCTGMNGRMKQIDATILQSSPIWSMSSTLNKNKCRQYTARADDGKIYVFAATMPVPLKDDMRVRICVDSNDIHALNEQSSQYAVNDYIRIDIL